MKFTKVKTYEIKYDESESGKRTNPQFFNPKDGNINLEHIEATLSIETVSSITYHKVAGIKSTFYQICLISSRTIYTDQAGIDIINRDIDISN